MILLKLDPDKNVNASWSKNKKVMGVNLEPLRSPFPHLCLALCQKPLHLPLKRILWKGRCPIGWPLKAFRINVYYSIIIPF